MKQANPKHILNTDFLFVGLCLVFFSLVFTETFTMGDPMSYRLPRLLSGFGIAVSLAVFVFNARSILVRALEIHEMRQRREGLHIGKTSLFFIAYFILTPLLGFHISSFLLILGFAFLIQYANKSLSLLMAVLLPVLLYYIFNSILNVTLSAGLLAPIL